MCSLRLWDVLVSPVCCRLSLELTEHKREMMFGSAVALDGLLGIHMVHASAYSFCMLEELHHTV